MLAAPTINRRWRISAGTRQKCREWAQGGSAENEKAQRTPLTTIRQIWSPTSCPAPFHAGSLSAASSVTSQRRIIQLSILNTTRDRQGCRSYGNSHGYRYGMSMGTVISSHTSIPIGLHGSNILSHIISVIKRSPACLRHARPYEVAKVKHLQYTVYSAVIINVIWKKCAVYKSVSRNSHIM